MPVPVGVSDTEGLLDGVSIGVLVGVFEGDSVCETVAGPDMVPVGVGVGEIENETLLEGVSVGVSVHVTDKPGV